MWRGGPASICGGLVSVVMPSSPCGCGRGGFAPTHPCESCSSSLRLGRVQDVPRAPVSPRALTHVPMHPCSHVPRSTCVPTYLYLHALVSPCPVLLSQLLRPMGTVPHPGRRNGNKFGARSGFLGSVSTGSMVTPALLSWEEGFGFSRCSSRSLRCSIEPTWSWLLLAPLQDPDILGG